MRGSFDVRYALACRNITKDPEGFEQLPRQAKTYRTLLRGLAGSRKLSRAFRLRRRPSLEQLAAAQIPLANHRYLLSGAANLWVSAKQSIPSES